MYPISREVILLPEPQSTKTGCHSLTFARFVEI